MKKIIGLSVLFCVAAFAQRGEAVTARAAAVIPRRLAVDTFLLAVPLPRGLPSRRAFEPPG